MSRRPDARPESMPSHPPGHPSDLTAAILARTSGPACGRLQDLACDLVDGALAADDLDLARLHLEHCPGCQALVSSLGAARLILPGFARLDPGPGFTASVLIRTRPASPRPALPQDPLLAGWARLMRRPRAALEAAYLATAAGLILTQVPLPGSLGPTGSALVSRVHRASRASAARALFHGQAWATRAKPSNPIRVLRHPERGWSTFWSRLTQRISQGWLDLAKAFRETRARIWRGGPVPPPTEPSGTSPRSAP